MTANDTLRALAAEIANSIRVRKDAGVEDVDLRMVEDWHERLHALASSAPAVEGEEPDEAEEMALHLETNLPAGYSADSIFAGWQREAAALIRQQAARIAALEAALADARARFVNLGCDPASIDAALTPQEGGSPETCQHTRSLGAPWRCGKCGHRLDTDPQQEPRHD